MKTDKNYLNANINLINYKITALAEGTEDTDSYTLGQAKNLINFRLDYCVKKETLNLTSSSLTKKVIQFNQQIIVKPIVIVYAFYIWNGKGWLLEPYYI